MSEDPITRVEVVLKGYGQIRLEIYLIPDILGVGAAAE